VVHAIIFGLRAYTISMLMKKEKIPPKRRGQGIPVAATESQQEVREL
jgi:hypothetical protein